MNNVIPSHCVACGSDHLFSVVDFGQQPAVNKLVTQQEECEPTFQLEYMACEKCGHGQMHTFVDPEYIFSNYHYASGTSKTLTDYFKWLAQFIEDNLPENETLLEIASNDGSCLKVMMEKKVAVYGIDPASNLIKNALAQGIPCEAGYWPQDFSRKSELFGGVVCQNVLAHTPDPFVFLHAMNEILAEEGFILIQTSQINMLEKGQFDTLYHEHYSFFTPGSIRTLLGRAGFHTQHQLVSDIHGDSLITIATKSPNVVIKLDALLSPPFFINQLPTPDALTSQEIHEQYSLFKQKSETSIQGTKNMVSKYVAAGRKIVFVGAAAKALTFLNVSGIQPDFLVDEATLKIGKLDPLKKFQIHSLQSLSELKEPLLCIISAWNFYSELKQKIKNLRPDQDTLFYRYFPESHLE